MEDFSEYVYGGIYVIEDGERSGGDDGCVLEYRGMMDGRMMRCVISVHLRAFPVDIREDFPSDALFQGISGHFRTIWKIQ